MISVSPHLFQHHRCLFIIPGTLPSLSGLCHCCIHWRLACFEMWAGEPISGKWSDLHSIGRRLVSRGYLHVILPRWLHLPRSFLPPYQHPPGPDTHPVTSLRSSIAGIVTLHATARLQSLSRRIRSYRPHCLRLRTHKNPMPFIEPFHLCLDFLSPVL